MSKLRELNKLILETIVVLFSIHTIYAQTDSDIRQELDELKQNQREMQKDLSEIKALLSKLTSQIPAQKPSQKPVPQQPPQIDVKGIEFNIGDNPVLGSESSKLIVVATEGDWKFSADNYLKYSPEEDWHVLTPEERVDRQTLINAANAWLDQFTYEDVRVPWGIPCARLEGGDYTGDGPRATCRSGITSETIEIVNRSYLVDEDMGTVNVFSRFGKTAADSSFGETPGLPDSHTIRLINGKLRYIHTITVIQ